ncbi:alkaline phosphatase family protein [Gillisia limnaea]|uniref:Phosphoesterase n=1 Tax=Gillisia limnaea (strain DSM 15749 / LMG 21470 / R-8282) TaxID=865937 RepID=H2BSZ3_GILLR|nr:alkaline phosphatase family protein [Gillisia limnaea]EHQ01523.1 phosphoesterase [Gillisia limnaea DSM 15749]
MATFLINRFQSNDFYGVWQFTPEKDQIFTRISIAENSKISTSLKLATVGGYLMEWGACEEKNGEKSFPYRLYEFDSASENPLGGVSVQEGSWPIAKFWGYRGHYSNYPNEQMELNLIPMGNFVLFFVGGEGRGTYELYNFDPNFLNPKTTDPIPVPYTSQGAFPSIQAGHELISIGNYVLDRMPDGNFRVWSFDPQNPTPLSIPEVWKGKWKGVTKDHQIVPVEDKIVTWNPMDLSYMLWDFKPTSEEPLQNLIKEGKLPEAMANSSSLVSISKREKNIKASEEKGTMNYMRSKIKHIVYYMVESRSFDNVCGWLYKNEDANIQFVGNDKAFQGASTENYNLDGSDKKIHQSKFNEGKLSDKIVLSDQLQDPFHDNSDGLEQMFYQRNPGYPGKAKPDMGGFVRNNANGEVMLSFGPEQLPILNGLAKNYAISDEWFSSVPGGTDINRAFAVTGSALNRLGTWEGGNPYAYWPKFPHRQSLWKLLWNYGISDWKIYNAIEWGGYPFTYHLYLEGQVPAIDNNSKNYIDTLDNFKVQAKNGNLPAFSFLEPVWIAPNGTTSYHPGADIIPAEIALNEIYEAIKSGPHWEDTLFVITFSKNGGIYDHVSPPYAQKPWPNDGLDGFEYDIMGPRVPAILVSPWIKRNTIFRAAGDIPFDSTSFAATLLKWYGIPISQWMLGDRIASAPTFEGVFLESEPRKDAPTLTQAYDKNFPGK